MKPYKNLKIWKRSVELATSIYEVTAEFPNEEKYGLVSQMRRSVVSISSNIAEGAGRTSSKEFKQFLNYAYGSSYELETQLIISANLGLVDHAREEPLLKEIDEIQKMIFTFSKSIEKEYSNLNSHNS